MKRLKLHQTLDAITESARSKRTSALLMEIKDRIYTWRCKKCGKLDVDILSLDCNHLTLCTSCFMKKPQCPICDVMITEHVKVFIN